MPPHALKVAVLELLVPLQKFPEPEQPVAKHVHSHLVLAVQCKGPNRPKVVCGDHAPLALHKHVHAFAIGLHVLRQYVVPRVGLRRVLVEGVVRVVVVVLDILQQHRDIEATVAVARVVVVNNIDLLCALLVQEVQETGVHVGKDHRRLLRKDVHVHLVETVADALQG